MSFKGNYKYFTNYNANAYTKGRGGHSIAEIVIHHWGVDGQRFIDVCNFFQSRNCQTSAHYVACAGNVACLVDCSDTAYHAGNWNVNQRSIGIECRPECSAEDIDTVAQLVAELWQAFPKCSRKLRIHKEFYATACPGRWESKLREIERLANDYLTGKKKVGEVAKPMFVTLKKGDIATISNHATHLKNGTVVTNEMKNKSSKIIEIINVQQSASKKAYLLEGLKDYVLEQDLEQARGKTPPTIVMLNIPSKNSEVKKTLGDVDNVVAHLDRIEKLTFGNARVQRGSEYVSVLQEIAEIRNCVDDLRKTLTRVFK